MTTLISIGMLVFALALTGMEITNLIAALKVSEKADIIIEELEPPKAEPRRNYTHFDLNATKLEKRGGRK